MCVLNKSIKNIIDAKISIIIHKIILQTNYNLIILFKFNVSPQRKTPSLVKHISGNIWKHVWTCLVIIGIIKLFYGWWNYMVEPREMRALIIYKLQLVTQHFV